MSKTELDTHTYIVSLSHTHVVLVAWSFSPNMEAVHRLSTPPCPHSHKDTRTQIGIITDTHTQLTRCLHCCKRFEAWGGHRPSTPPYPLTPPHRHPYTDRNIPHTHTRTQLTRCLHCCQRFEAGGQHGLHTPCSMDLVRIAGHKRAGREPGVCVYYILFYCAWVFYFVLFCCVCVRARARKGDGQM